MPSKLDLRRFDGRRDTPPGAAYAVTEDGEICAWNHAAERMFGYSAREVLARNIDEVFEAREALGTDALAGGLEAEHFSHWLAVLEATVDARFASESTERMKAYHRIAYSMQLRLGIPPFAEYRADLVDYG